MNSNMKNKELAQKLRKMGVHEDNVKLVMANHKTTIRNCLSSLGDCWTIQNKLRKGCKPVYISGLVDDYEPNNMNPEYNETMSELFSRWKSLKA